MKLLLIFLFLVLNTLAKEDYYKILGLQQGTDLDKVKKQFRKLSLKYHPDKNKSPQAEEKYKQITHAYQQIVDGNTQEDEQPYARDFRDFGGRTYTFTNNNRNYYQYSNSQGWQKQEQEKGSSLMFSLIFMVLIIVVGIQLMNFLKPSEESPKPNPQPNQSTQQQPYKQATTNLPKDIVEKVSNVSSYTESDRRAKFSQMYNQ